MNEERKKRLEEAVLNDKAARYPIPKAFFPALQSAADDDGVIYAAELRDISRKTGRKGKAVGQPIGALVKTGVLKKVEKEAPIDGAGQAYEVCMPE